MPFLTQLTGMATPLRGGISVRLTLFMAIVLGSGTANSQAIIWSSAGSFGKNLELRSRHGRVLEVDLLCPNAIDRNVQVAVRQLKYARTVLAGPVGIIIMAREDAFSSGVEMPMRQCGRGRIDLI
jgi:hypothetical protein